MILLHWTIYDVNESSESVPGPVMILYAALLDHFSEVNDHHQNGQAQRHIRPLQGLEFSYMVHSHHQWSSAITANLWTYAILHTYAIINENPCQRLNYNYTSTQMFTESNVYSNPRYWQPLFCPLCVLSCPFAV